MKLSEGFLNPQSHFTRTSSLKSIRWLGLNLSTDSHTHTHSGWELQSLHSRLLTTQSFSRLLDPHAFQIVFAKVKCNVQLAGPDGVNGEDEEGGGDGENNPSATNERRKLKWCSENSFSFSFLFFSPPSHTMKQCHIESKHP